MIASYPSEVQERLADLRTGISSKCKFLPTINEIVEMADPIERSIADRAITREEHIRAMIRRNEESFRRSGELA